MAPVAAQAYSQTSRPLGRKNVGGKKDQAFCAADLRSLPKVDGTRPPLREGRRSLAPLGVDIAPIRRLRMCRISPPSAAYSSRSKSSSARTWTRLRRRQAETIAAMQRRVGSIRPNRIRSRCWRLYPDSRARCAGLIRCRLRKLSSLVGMCRILHYTSEQEGRQSSLVTRRTCVAARSMLRMRSFPHSRGVREPRSTQSGHLRCHEGFVRQCPGD